MELVFIPNKTNQIVLTLQNGKSFNVTTIEIIFIPQPANNPGAVDSPKSFTVWKKP
jgi:hypothetical protein